MIVHVFVCSIGYCVCLFVVVLSLSVVFENVVLLCLLLVVACGVCVLS